MMCNAIATETSSAYEVYGPFGNIETSEGTLVTDNPYRFSTKYTDSETDLVYYGYRYYDPELGRWLSRDPLGEKIQRKGIPHKYTGMPYDFSLFEANLYIFAKNNSLKYIDKDGRVPTTGALWGYWCGSGWTGGQNISSSQYDWNNDPSPRVHDALDLCCRLHDGCYAGRWWSGHPYVGWGVTNDSQNDCDRELCSCAESFQPSGRSDATAKRLIMCTMCIRSRT